VYNTSSIFTPDYVAQGKDFLLLHERIFHDDSYCFIACEKNNPCGSFCSLIIAGFFLGLASLVRPVGQYVIIVSLVLILFSLGDIREKFIKSFGLFLGWMYPVSFWLIRNFLLTGYLFFHTLPGGHFLYLSAARVAMHVQNCSYQEARQNLKKEVNDCMNNWRIKKGRELSEIERCYVHEQIAQKYFKRYPLLSLRNWMTDMLRTSFSLYSAELLFLDSGRKEIDYFAQNRSVCSFFTRYLRPSTHSWWLKYVIYYEILAFVFLLILLCCGFLRLLKFLWQKSWTTINILACTWVRAFAFSGLFVVLALSGGYARMRLPIEPLMIILALNFILKKEIVHGNTGNNDEGL
jgi:hypothetical protein